MTNERAAEPLLSEKRRTEEQFKASDGFQAPMDANMQL